MVAIIKIYAARPIVIQILKHNLQRFLELHCSIWVYNISIIKMSVIQFL